MKKWIVIFLLGFFQLTVAQTTEDNQPITVVIGDKATQARLNPKPEYPGGMTEFYNFIGQTFKIADGESGKLFVRFVINTDGSLSDIVIVRDIGPKSSKQILKILEKCPKWKPGILDGKPVRVEFLFPITVKG